MLDTGRPEAILNYLDSESRVFQTPCGDGHMVWREWGSGPVLVLLHGGNGSWRHWVRNIQHFAQRHTVLCPDLPGLGESANPPEPLTPQSVAGVVLRGIEQIVPHGARYDLAGFSFGALVGSQVGAHADARLRSLTILGAGSLGVARQPTPLTKLRDKEGAERVQAHRANLASLMIHEVAKIDDLAVVIQEWNTVHARFRSRGFATATVVKDGIAATRAPVSVIYGERDAIAYPHLQDRIDAIHEVRPEAPVTVVPNAGHWVMYEAPAETNAALDGFLARL